MTITHEPFQVGSPAAKKRSKTPSGGRKSPAGGKKTPSGGKKSPSGGKKTPSGGKKSPAGGRKGAAVDPQRTDSPARPPALTADELMNRQKKIQMCREYKEALLIEGIYHTLR
jgi:hypothetical protein